MYGVPLDDVWNTTSLLSQTVMSKNARSQPQEIMATGNTWPPRWMKENSNAMVPVSNVSNEPIYENMVGADYPADYAQPNRAPSVPQPQPPHSMPTPPQQPSQAQPNKYEQELRYLKALMYQMQNELEIERRKQTNISVVDVQAPAKRDKWSNIFNISIIVLLVLILLLIINVSQKINQLVQTPIGLRAGLVQG